MSWYHLSLSVLPVGSILYRRDTGLKDKFLLLVFPEPQRAGKQSLEGPVLQNLDCEVLGRKRPSLDRPCMQ